MPISETSRSKAAGVAAANSISKNSCISDDIGRVSAVRVAVNFPSRYIPVLGLVLAIFTIFSSMILNRYYGNDAGVLPWPYIR